MSFFTVHHINNTLLLHIIALCHPFPSITLPFTAYLPVFVCSCLCRYAYSTKACKQWYKVGRHTVYQCFGNHVDRRLIVVRSKRARARSTFLSICCFQLLLLLIEALYKSVAVYNFCRLAIPISSVDLLLWSIKDACININKNINIHSKVVLYAFMKKKKIKVIFR